MLINLISSFISLISDKNNRNSPFQTTAGIIIWKLFQKHFALNTIFEIENSTKLIIPANSSYGSLLIYSAGTIDYNESSIIKKLLRHDDIFIDIGANIGYYTLLASSLINSGSIFAFEPNHKLCKLIEQSLMLSEVSKDIYRVLPTAVGSKNGFAQFVIEDQSELSHLTELSTIKATKVPITTLDSIVSTNKIRNIRLVKIDTEGAEPEVFQGMKKSLQNGIIDAILFEHSIDNIQNIHYLNCIKNCINAGYELRMGNYSFSISLQEFLGDKHKSNVLLIKKSVVANTDL
jgi:FkbM family methyltransferase